MKWKNGAKQSQTVNLYNMRSAQSLRIGSLDCNVCFFENIEQFQNIFFSFCNPKKLTKENCELDVRIAVIEHEITQKVLKMATAH